MLCTAKYVKITIICFKILENKPSLLPPASEGWQEVIFSVCPHFGGGTRSSLGWVGGSQSSLGRGGYPNLGQGGPNPALDGRGPVPAGGGPSHGGLVSAGGESHPWDISHLAILILPVWCPSCKWALFLWAAPYIVLSPMEFWEVRLSQEIFGR